MKILFLTESYYPDVNGISNVVGYLAEGLVRLGHEVLVFTEKRNRERLSNNGVEIREFNCKGNIVTGYSGNIEEYRKAIKEFEGDVIIAECAQIWCTDLILDILNELKPIKILHSHDFSYFKIKPKNPISRIKWIYYFSKLKKYMRYFDGVICLNNNLPDACWFRAHGFSNVFELPNTVRQEFFISNFEMEDRVLKKYNLQEGKYFISVGNYTKIKNQKALIKEYIKSEVQSDLLLIGSKYNEYSNDIISYINQNTKITANIQLLADIPLNEHVVLLRNSKAFLYASLWEALPLVICEAIVTGTPWFSTNVGCIDKLPGGIIVNSINSFRYLLPKIENNKELLNKLRNECLQARDMFHPNNTVAKLIDIIKTIQTTRGNKYKK